MRSSRISLSYVKAVAFALLYAAASATLSAQSMMKAAPQAQADAQVSVSGSIASISGGTIFVTQSGGAVTSVGLGKDTLILGRKSDTLDSIKSGDALGVAAVREKDGSLTATVINIFAPELWRRVRKGQFPMASGQVMTNAQVERTSAGVQGRTIFLKYDMLTAAVTVPSGAEIHRSVALSLADLKPGEVVTARGVAGADGLLAASTLSLEL
jgi:Cu/Ag efflux protein CusF